LNVTATFITSILILLSNSWQRQDILRDIGHGHIDKKSKFAKLFLLGVCNMGFSIMPQVSI
jgi:hypothetical protein